MDTSEPFASTSHLSIQPISAVGYGYPWLQDFVKRGTGIDLDLEQMTTVAKNAERKLTDLFDVAADTASANGRQMILRHDLPLTKGLRRVLEDVAILAKEIALKPLLTFLEDAGFRGPHDDLVRSEIPRLMAALLLLEGRIIAILEPDNIPPADRFKLLTRAEVDQPSDWELERAGRVLDLTL